MMHRWRFFYVFFFIYTFICHGINFQQIGTGIAASFGACPYTLSVSFWNNFEKQILFAIQPIINISGAFMWTSSSHYPVKSAILQPYTFVTFANTTQLGNVCPASAIWFDVNWPWGTVNPLDYATSRALLVQTLLQQNAITNTPFQLKSQQGDTNVYYYNVYSAKGTPIAEFIGPNLYGGPYTTTKDFSGTFFNNTSADILLTFPYNKDSYSVTIEPQTFAILNPPSGTPVRSATAQLTFSHQSTNKTIPLGAQGLGTYYINENNQQITTPVSYTFEMYESTQGFDVGIQGFNLGNHNDIGFADPPHDTAIAGIRDITPIPCHIWNQSAATAMTLQGATTSSENQYVDLPGQIWVSYITHDQTIQQTLPLSSTNFNGITTITLLRPRIEEGPQNLYIFLIPPQFTNETIIKKYLSNVTQSIPSKDILYTQAPTLNDNHVLTSITMVPITHAKLYDKNTGITGTLLLVDQFQPLGMIGAQRYYTLLPSIFQPAIATQLGLTLEPLVTQFIDPQRDPQASKTFAQNILTWFTTFNKNAVSLINQMSGTPSPTLGKKMPTLQEALTNVSVIDNVIPELMHYIRQNGQATLFDPLPTKDQSRNNLAFSQQTYQNLYYMLYGPVSFANPPFLQQSGSNTYVYNRGKTPPGWPS